ncbi:single-stranded DNA-binding protein, partial [Cyanobium sp. HWJ4-Hawea]|uniref:single-stranded DNA-binding protein n=1 Tax=Cyanobium sp. HWJ4-Hawea TaxID=2823713 RepID=UPI0020CC2BD2
GWGNLAQDLQNRVQVGQRLVLEGRLRMNTVTRQDGVKEKKAEFTLARIHSIGAASPVGSGGNAPVASSTPPPQRRVVGNAPAPMPAITPGASASSSSQAASPAASAPAAPAWNSSPLVPDLGEDDIPF